MQYNHSPARTVWMRGGSGRLQMIFPGTGVFDKSRPSLSTSLDCPKLSGDVPSVKHLKVNRTASPLPLAGARGAFCVTMYSAAPPAQVFFTTTSGAGIVPG